MTQLGAQLALSEVQVGPWWYFEPWVGTQVATSLTRATNGVTVDPSSDHRLAGYGDNQIHIWDTRNFEKPLVSLEQERHVHR